MFATARYATAAAFATVLLGSTSPTFAADRVTGTSFGSVDFTLPADNSSVAGVVPAIPPALLANILTAPAVPVVAPATPLADAAQRPIDIAMPRSDGAGAGTSIRRVMYVSFAALQVMDLVSTNKAISAGAVEANPAMSGIVKNKGAFMAVKVGTAAAAAFFSEKLAKNHPRRATIVMAVLNTVYAGVVAHNYRVAKAQR